MRKFTPNRNLTGGLRLPANKTESTSRPIKTGPIPPRLIVSMRQHHGPAAVPSVAVGDTVHAGETIGRSIEHRGADVHAPSSGTVTAIECRSVPLHSAVANEVCVVIDTDGQHRCVEAPPAFDPELKSRDETIAAIAAAGIVGLGGAAYPTAAKLASGAACKLLILNGAECEPYISCDDMLMREAARDIVAGAEWLRRIAGARESVIAIERDKPQAIEAIDEAAEALGADHLRIAEIPSVYPAGGERQLIEILTGFEIPTGHFPSEFGYVCQNVGTAYAIARLFEHREPLTTRIVTITGSGVAEPCNVAALIGTPIADLIAHCGGYTGDVLRLLHGGSMMGYALDSDALPITKTSNCIVAAADDEISVTQHEWSCIRCGECANVCPARLQPQDLLIAAEQRDPASLTTLGLADCIECGCCDVVCPSHIRLTERFRSAKPALARHLRDVAFADESDARYRWREQRRRGDAAREHERQAALREQADSQAKARAAIEAAVQRARSKKRQPSSSDV